MRARRGGPALSAPAADLVERMLAGDRVALAKLMRRVENDARRRSRGDGADRAPLRPRATLGVTGPPGAGKSTLVERVDGRLRARARRRHRRRRSVEPVLRRRRARRPHPDAEPLSRPGGVHPQPERARQRGGLARATRDGAVARRVRQGSRDRRDRRRRPERARRHAGGADGRRRAGAGSGRHRARHEGRIARDRRHLRGQQGRPRRREAHQDRARDDAATPSRRPWAVPVLLTDASRERGIPELVVAIDKHRMHLESDGTARLAAEAHRQPNFSRSSARSSPAVSKGARAGLRQAHGACAAWRARSLQRRPRGDARSRKTAPGHRR